MQGRVIWITGLSGAGKSTLAKALIPHFNNAILLDGDNLRHVLGITNTGYDTNSRKKLAMTYARMAQLLADQGYTVIMATISLYHAVHTWNRENLPQYLEVFLDIPEEIRRARDPKGLYAAEKKGTLSLMAGLQVAVEFPLAPHLHLREKSTIEQNVTAILHSIKEKTCTQA